MKTYLVKQKGEKLQLVFNCNVCEHNQENLKKDEIRQYIKEDCLAEFAKANRALIDKFGVINAKNNNDRFIEGDWVYIETDGNILHIESPEAEHYGNLKWQLAMKEDYDEDLFDEYEEKRIEAMIHPHLLSKKEDKEYCKPSTRIKRMLQKGNY